MFSDGTTVWWVLLEAAFWGFARSLGPFSDSWTHYSSCIPFGNFQVPHPHQVVCRCREGEHPAHHLQPAVPQLSHPSHRLHPSENFFNPGSLLLTHPSPAEPEKGRV